MKLKDIQVGALYACGPPNRRHRSVVKVKVLEVGVYAEVSGQGGWHRSTSERATFVEVEVLGKYRPVFPTRVLTQDYRGRKKGDVWINSSFHSDPKAPTREAYRVPAGHILCTWAEEEERQELAARAKAEAKAEAKERRGRLDAALATINGASGLELTPRWGNDCRVELDLGELERLAAVLEEKA